MSETETLDLHWEGPVSPTYMDMNADALERMARPGVYLCLQHYPEAQRVRAYAGVTKNFRLRLREHVAATLGLTYDIADETGRVVFRHTHRDSLFDAAHDVDTLHPLAAAEVKRMTWFFALDDSDPFMPWHIVEGMLIRSLKSAAITGETLSDGAHIDVVNERGGPAPGGPLVIRNLGADEAIDILGPELVWPEKEAA